VYTGPSLLMSIESLTAALLSDRENAALYEQRSMAFLDAGDAEAALHDANEAVCLHGGATSYIRRGDALSASDRVAAAFAAFCKALEAGGDDEVAKKIEYLQGQAKGGMDPSPGGGGVAATQAYAGMAYALASHLIPDETDDDKADEVEAAHARGHPLAPDRAGADTQASIPPEGMAGLAAETQAIDDGDEFLVMACVYDDAVEADVAPTEDIAVAADAAASSTALGYTLHLLSSPTSPHRTQHRTHFALLTPPPLRAFWVAWTLVPGRRLMLESTNAPTAPSAPSLPGNPGGGGRHRGACVRCGQLRPACTHCKCEGACGLQHSPQACAGSWAGRRESACCTRCNSAKRIKRGESASKRRVREEVRQAVREEVRQASLLMSVSQTANPLGYSEEDSSSNAHWLVAMHTHRAGRGAGKRVRVEGEGEG